MFLHKTTKEMKISFKFFPLPRFPSVTRGNNWDFESLMANLRASRERSVRSALNKLVLASESSARQYTTPPVPNTFGTGALIR
jgi:hypothetical protein